MSDGAHRRQLEIRIDAGDDFYLYARVRPDDLRALRLVRAIVVRTVKQWSDRSRAALVIEGQPLSAVQKLDIEFHEAKL